MGTPFRVIPGLLALSVAVGAGIVAAPSAAEAQSTVLVLGVRSMEGDDEFTRNLTGAVRHAASQIDDWSVSEREVTLAQMALAHGCADPDAACMSNIAQALEADFVIYGDVRRTSAGDSFDFSLNMHIFNRASEQIEHSVAETIPGIRRDIDDLREPARRFVAALSGAPRTGTLSVLVNVPGAEVFIDGESAGTADGEGHLVVSDIPAGTRNVRIVAEGHQNFRSTVTIEAYGEATFEAELEAGEGGGGGGSISPLTVAGLISTGLGVVAAAIWIGGYFHIQGGIGSDQNNTSSGGEDWGSARVIYGRYPPGHPNYVDGTENRVTDICAEARGPNADMFPVTVSNVRGREFVVDLCDSYDTWLPIQIGAGIAAGVLGGAGIAMLIAGLSDDGGDAEAARITVTPAVSQNYTGVNVVGAF